MIQNNIYTKQHLQHDTKQHLPVKIINQNHIEKIVISITFVRRILQLVKMKMADKC